MLLSGSLFGLPQDLVVYTASQTRRFGVAGGLPDRGDAPVAAPDQAAGSFVEDLLRRGGIEAGTADVGDAPIGPSRVSTHEIVSVDGSLELRRRRFD
jgi:hypothetical protein